MPYTRLWGLFTKTVECKICFQVLLTKLKVVVNPVLPLVPTGKPIIRLTCRYCEYLLNINGPCTLKVQLTVQNLLSPCRKQRLPHTCPGVISSGPRPLM